MLDYVLADTDAFLLEGVLRPMSHVQRGDVARSVRLRIFSESSRSLLLLWANSFAFLCIFENDILIGLRSLLVEQLFIRLEVQGIRLVLLVFLTRVVLRAISGPLVAKCALVLQLAVSLLILLELLRDLIQNMQVFVVDFILLDSGWWLSRIGEVLIALLPICKDSTSLVLRCNDLALLNWRILLRQLLLV